jgi:hypothetical protein
MRHQQIRFAFLAVAGVMLSAVAADARIPAGRFVVSTDTSGGSPTIGIVLDQKTGLTWERSPGPLGTRDAAFGHCLDLELNSDTPGWRLPTLKELLSLVDYAGDYGPNALIDQTIFPNTPPFGFWSSTSSAARPAQCVDFTQGWLGCYERNYVRCVR